MRLTAFIVSILTLAAKPCLSGLTVTRYTTVKSELVEASIDILESCYTERFGTVGLAGPLIGNIIESISSRGIVIPVVPIDEASWGASLIPPGRRSRHKLQVFIVTVSSSRQLGSTLRSVRNTKWWNHMASFLLIDSSEVNPGCSNAAKILWEAWKMNLLNSKFMCVHPTRGVLIYTFNPYTSKAPVPWQQENTYKGMNSHIWTLFAWEYRSDKPRCGALDFDKTLDLGGYEIGACVLGKYRWDHNSSVEVDSDKQFKNVTARMFMDSLNATWKLMPVTEEKEGNRTIKSSDRAQETPRVTCDIFLPYFVLSDAEIYDTTYPSIQFSLTIMTQYSGNKSQLEKLISVLDRKSRFGVVVVLLITLLFVKFFLRKPMIPAILNLVLITVNAALLIIPKKLGLRIYLGSLLMFVVTIQGIYQSQLATLLTSNVRLKNINSIEDLAQSDHTIYGLPSFKIFLNGSAFEGRYIPSDSESCMQHVVRDSKAACLDTKANIISWAAKYKLHLADKWIGATYGAYVIRPDWPLEQRANAINKNIFESGIVDRLSDSVFKNDINSIKSYEYEYRHQAVKVMTLETLSFAFVILAIGLGCATITFIVEVAYFGRAIAEPRRRTRTRIRLIK